MSISKNCIQRSNRVNLEHATLLTLTKKKVAHISYVYSIITSKHIELGSPGWTGSKANAIVSKPEQPGLSRSIHSGVMI